MTKQLTKFYDTDRPHTIRSLPSDETVWDLAPDEHTNVDWNPGVIGWRTECITRSPRGFILRNFPHQAGRSTPAHCTDYSHQAPDPACECGYRIVRNLTQLSEHWDRVTEVGDSRGSHVSSLAMAIVRVRASGAITGRYFSGFPSDDDIVNFSDPEHTLRVGSMELVGPLLIPQNVRHYAKALTRSYPRLHKAAIAIKDIYNLDGGAPVTAQQTVPEGELR
ncbi:hypothetical protein [Streptomyces sp. MZ04]|uniref:hypothetical protein n=1 Tax=Streptomyces sp. MZ04 TaxID=2559236 RepID=UPI00107E9728|nr:hypothetical protein [Streptomyces sp. MZ04]TGB09777.1 hypothetical protein E2651_15620 [Streptomyces sp. MZ04]